MKTVYRTGIVAGLVPALFKTVVFFSGYTEIYGGSYTNLIELIVVAIAIPFSMYMVRKESNGLLPFNNALKTGIGTTAVAGVIMCLFTFIYFRFMNTSMQLDAINDAIKYATENKLSEEETKKTIEGARQFFSPFVQATSALFGIMLTGFLVSIVSTLILKKEN